MTPTKEQRAMMAAHVCDLFAKALREGDTYDSSQAISLIIADDRAEEFYRYGLGCYGASSADIDAAVAAIARGEHPADSLAGRVDKRRRDSLCKAAELADADPPLWAAANYHGDYAAAFGDVLDLLGCKVTP